MDQLAEKIAEKMAIEADRVFGVKDIIARMPCKESKVRRMIREGRIPSFKDNGTIFVYRKHFLRAAEQGFPLPKGRVRMVA